MEIDKIINDDELVVKLKGRLDTNTVSELDKEMVDLDGIEKIVFDFEDLEYISSSGLRLILKYKKMIDETEVINCNKEVYDIFNMTGFTELMDVKKAFRSISIDNCEKIGEGFYGDIYRIDPETIVKVFKVPDALDLIRKEAKLSKKAFVMGIPTAISFDIVRVGDLYGTVFELIDSKMLVDVINKDNVDKYTKKCADVLKNMHKKEIEKEELPSRKNEVINLLKECEKLFSKEIFNKLVHLLETIPESNKLLHCDFHVKNIMLQDDDLLIIDMDTLSVGHPIFEFASMFATYIGFSCVDKKNTDKFLGLPLSLTTEIFNKTIGYYYEDKTEEEMEDIKLKLSVISYIQILRIRNKFGNNLSNTQEEEIEFCKNYLTECASKLDTLEYK